MFTDQEQWKTKDTMIESLESNLDTMRKMIEQQKSEIEIRDDLLQRCCGILEDIGLQNRDIYKKIQSVIKKQWYDNIPEHGILIKHKEDGDISVTYGAFSNINEFEPLTNEEIEAFKR